MPEQATLKEQTAVEQATVKAAPAASGSEVSLKPVTKTREILHLLSTAIPIIGFVGTLFVWTVANFYIGAVDVQVPGSYNELVVRVFDRKGQESTVHTPQFQLMPGKYHLSVKVDKNDPQQMDTEIVFGKTSVVKVAASATSAPTPSESSAPQAVRKHWWQFWKKGQANKDASNDPANDSLE